MPVLRWRVRLVSNHPPPAGLPRRSDVWKPERQVITPPSLATTRLVRAERCLRGYRRSNTPIVSLRTGRLIIHAKIHSTITRIIETEAQFVQWNSQLLGVSRNSAVLNAGGCSRTICFISSASGKKGLGT